MPDATHAIVRAALSADDIARIGADLDESTLEPGMVSSAGVPSDERANLIAWLPRPDWQWLYDRLHIAASGANVWGLDVSGVTDEVQFTRYEPGEHYDWHTDWADVENDPTAYRSLSIVALVREPESGGALELRGSGALELRVGDAVVFPANAEHRATSVHAGRRESVVLWLASAVPATARRLPPGSWRAIPHIAPPEDNPDSWWFMTPEMFETGIHQLVREGLVLPYGIMPGSHPEGVATAVQTSWANWKRRYGFNPPDFMAHLEEFATYDSAAGPKPTWATIRRAADRGRTTELRNAHLAAIVREGERRIVEAYGARNLDDEFKRRLSGRTTAAQDTERTRLVAKHDALETWLESTDRTLAELEAFDPADDAHWAA